MGCLALNASFEPLTLIPPRRAVRLVLDGKAEVLEVSGGAAFRSVGLSLPSPAVIRLMRYVHVPRRFRRQVTNTFLFARDGYACQYCGRTLAELHGRQFLTRDHVMPVSRGGDNSWLNVVTACSACNHRKGDRLLSEVGMTLLAPPREPNHVHLMWAVRRVTAVQSRYIGLFYGEDVVRALLEAGGGPDFAADEEPVDEAGGEGEGAGVPPCAQGAAGGTSAPRQLHSHPLAPRPPTCPTPP